MSASQTGDQGGDVLDVVVPDNCGACLFIKETLSFLQSCLEGRCRWGNFFFARHARHAAAGPQNIFHALPSSYLTRYQRHVYLQLLQTPLPASPLTHIEPWQRGMKGDW